MAAQPTGSGYVGDLSSSQEEALKQFRSKLPKSEGTSETKIVDGKTYAIAKSASADDAECLRFLRAHKWNVEAAVPGFVKYLEWRYSVDADNIVKDAHKRKTDMLHIIVPHAYHGFDREGRPLYFEKTGKVHVEALLNSFSDTEALREHINFMETQAGRCAEGSKIVGKPVETWSTVMDLKGTHSGHRKALKLFKMYANCDTPNYPERMGFIMVINAPWIFPTLYNIIKRWLDPVTQKKIFVVGGNPTEELLKLIPAENLPSEYGGSCKCGKAPNCIPEYDINELKKYHRSSAAPPPSSSASGVTDGDATPEPTVLKIPARRSCSVDVTVEGGNSISWFFHIDSHDIQFSVEFIPSSSAASTTSKAEAKSSSSSSSPSKERIWIYQPTRVSASSGLAVQGSHTLKDTESGLLRLVWDNSYSYFTAKTVRYELVLSDSKTDDLQATAVGTVAESAEASPPATDTAVETTANPTST